jgi:hypothetical protein
MGLFKKWYEKLPYKPVINTNKYSHAQLLEAALKGRDDIARILVEGGHITDEGELAQIVEANKSFACDYILNKGLIKDKATLKRLAENERLESFPRIAAARKVEDYDLAAKLSMVVEKQRESAFHNGYASLPFLPNSVFVAALSRTKDAALAREIVEYATKDRTDRSLPREDFRRYLDDLESATVDKSLRAMIQAKRKAFFDAKPNHCICVHPVDGRHEVAYHQGGWDDSYSHRNDFTLTTVYCQTCSYIVRTF